MTLNCITTGCDKKRSALLSRCYTCNLEYSRTKECTVVGCLEMRHSTELCRKHYVEKNRVNNYKGGKKFECILCGDEIQIVRGKKGVSLVKTSLCKSTKNIACFNRCRAFNALGERCPNDRKQPRHTCGRTKCLKASEGYVLHNKL
jgi:hypothetical protein